MNKNLSLPLLFLPLAVFSCVASADDKMLPAQKIIKQMSEANRNFNYEGDFVYHYQGEIHNARIIHKAGISGIQERIISLTGFAREIIRNGNSVTCILPDIESVMIEKSGTIKFSISSLAERIVKAAQYYVFSLSGQERIAGRASWIIDITPKDEYRYGYQLWIDLDTKLLLKSQLKNEKNQLLEQFFFVNLEILDEIPDERLRPVLAGGEYTWYDNSSNTVLINASEAFWKASWAPEGFFMNSWGRQSTNNSGYIEHLMYTDGLTLISIFIEKFEEPQPMVTGHSGFAGVNAFSTMPDGYLITAIGEVPSGTVESFAKSIVPAK